MAKVSREQAEINHERIEASAANLFREHGLNGVSVAEVMADAGLTHGGFYGHFASKEALAASACSRAFEQSRVRWNGLASKAQAEDRLLAVARHYLSEAHRDHLGHGCAASALAADVARTGDDAEVRGIYTSGVKGMVGQLTGMSTGEGTARKRQLSLAYLSMMVGALSIARATKNDEFSDEILDATLAVIGELEGRSPGGD